MQVTGTFPELSAGMAKKKSKRKSLMVKEDPGYAGFSLKRRPKVLKKNPTSFAGRRAAARAKTGS